MISVKLFDNDDAVVINFKRNEKGEIELVEDKQFEGTGIKCEKCGAELVFKKTRFGEVIACPEYPECKNIKNFLRTPEGQIKILEAGQALDEKCPECSKPLTLKSGKNGMFAACSGYPECKFTANIEMKDDGTIGIKPNTPNESGEVCEKCGKKIEFVNDAIEDLQNKVCRVHDFIPTTHHMVLYGVCADCRKKA